MKVISKLILVFCILSLTGCAWFKTYHVPVQQGNVVTPAMKAQLKKGMSKNQVTFLLGSPLLDTPLNANQWVYVYTVQHKGKIIQNRHLIINFRKGQLWNYHTKIITGQPFVHVSQL